MKSKSIRWWARNYPSAFWKSNDNSIWVDDIVVRWSLN